MSEEDPNLLADMEEIFELAGVGEAFQQTLRTGDPRYLLTAMKSSETFHCEFIIAQHIMLSYIPLPARLLSVFF